VTRRVLRLWLWVEGEQAVSAVEREVTLGAKLIGPVGRHGGYPPPVRTALSTAVVTSTRGSACRP
jgi:hypothetical protein